MYRWAMKVLIIGGTGLISSSISRQLLERGDEVVLFNRGKSERRFPDGAAQIIGNRYDAPSFIQAIQESGPFDVAIDMITYNPKDAHSLVEACAGVVKQVIFCSTVDVYGKPAKHFPYTEAEPRDSLTQYGRDKTTCEDIVAEGAKTHGYEWTVIRPAATYGPGGVIIHTFGWKTTFLDRLVKGKPVIVMGDGSSLWGMCHSEDCAKAFVGACLNPKAYGEAYHATSEEWITWNQFHLTVAEVLGAPSPTLIHIPTDVLDRFVPEQASITTYNFQHSNIYDNSKAKNDLGFEFTIPFSVGAKMTIDHIIAKGGFEESDSEPWYDSLIAQWETAINTIQM